MNPTVILVHGAFAESSSWKDVVTKVTGDGHRVIAFANPLRSLAGDAAGLTELVKTIDGPIVLAGHSYGGAVITNVPAEAGDIVGLVFVAAFALEPGESPGAASSVVPGGTLAETLETVPLPGGGVDAYIAQEKFRAQFCADVPQEDAALMAVTQRPITEARCLSPPGTIRCGGGFRAGSSSGTRTETSRSAPTGSWPSGRARRAPSRYPAHHTSSGSRTPRRRPK